jgi:hypothetical protein
VPGEICRRVGVGFSSKPKESFARFFIADASGERQDAKPPGSVGADAIDSLWRPGVLATCRLCHKLQGECIVRAARPFPLKWYRPGGEGFRACGGRGAPLARLPAHRQRG